MEENNQEVTPLNIYQKVLAIASEIKGLEKDMKVGTQYKAISDKAVVKAVKEQELKFGVLSYPENVELIDHQILTSPPNKDGRVTITYVDIVKMTLRLVNIDNPNETITVTSFGRGIDCGDKGFGKALTYARKYALLNAYKIVTGEDPDEFKSEPIETTAPEDIKRLKVENYLLTNDDIREKAYSHFNVGDIKEFEEEVIAKIYNNILKKGVI